MSSLAGQTFAGYEVLGKLGEGGMGSVFKARQPVLNRLVALKVMATQLGSDSMFVSRFRREANAAAALNHENIVQVFSAGESEGTHYIAMEFVEGKTLRQHIDSHGKLDPREAIAITVYVAKALQYAWNKAKLIHRDIKPENIFLSNTGEVKVGDLGLAKTVGGETTSLTQTGMMMGSPNYISPEQARGLSDIDFRTDIYSLGCTLYHMLTGRPPYSGSDPLVVITKHVNDPPPAIFKVWPTCPIPLALAMGKMLTKNRNDRPASYEDLIAQLQEVHDKLKPAATVAPVTGTGPAKAPTATPTPKPASATPRPSVAKTPTAVPRAKPTRWSSRFSVPLLSRLKPKLQRIVLASAVVVVVGVAALLWWSPWKNVGGASTPRSSSSTSADGRGVAAPPGFQTASGPWMDGLAEWWAKPENAKSGVLVKEAGGSRKLDPKAGVRFAQGRDIAIRATVTAYKGTTWFMGLRSGKTGGNYSVQLAPHGKPSTIKLFLNGEHKLLQEFSVPPGFRFDQSHTMEFRAQGDVLTVVLDGREVARVQDGALPGAGSAFIAAGPGTLLEKLEYRDLSAGPAAGSGPLFDGRDTSAWQHPDGGDCQWQVSDGALVTGRTDLETREKFQDFELHIEFVIPRDAKPGNNSGVFLQGRYEVQILDSFGSPVDGASCGAIHKVKAPTENASKPLDQWQSFDITFHAARYDAAGKKTANARASVVHNGRLIHNNVEIPGKTSGGEPESAAPGPIRLQAFRLKAHGSPVRFRNISVRPLDETATAAPAAVQQPRQTLDLLALTDPVKDRIKVERGASHSKANAWERRGSALAYVSDGGSGKLAPPVAINARSYEIEVDFERLSGEGRFHVDLPLDGNRIIPLNFDSKNKMVNCRAGDPWPANRGPRARVVVRLDRSPNDEQDRITVRLDGELVVDWQGNAASVAQGGEAHPDFPGQPATSIYIHKDSYEVRFWQLRVFDGEATVLRGSATMPADFPKETSLDLGGGVKMELVLVPAGEFMMGSNDGPANEKPVHKVRISAPFYMGKYEVTVGQFKRFVAETRYQTEAERFNNGWMATPNRGWGPVPGVNWRTPVKFTQADDHPVCVVSWNDIQEFCKWASKQTGRAVRLPTEAQWEYACRAGTTTQFNTTDKDSELGEAAWFAANSGQRTHPVGQKKPNAWGLYDMHGNLYEMVQEFYSDKYDAEQFVVDPQGSAAGGGRQMRDGGWGNNPASVRSACRKKIGLDEASIGNTFRVITDMLPASKSVASQTAPADAASQDAINLLLVVDLSQDVNSGKWEAAPDGLKATDIKSMSQKIQPPYRPPEEYDLRVSFTPISGNADVAIGLTAKGRSFVFYMKKYAKDHCLGFEAISGKNIAGGPTAHRFPHLEMGSRYTVVVEVRKNGLRGYLDGKLVAEWATDYSDMTAWPVWKFKDDTLPGFGCSLSTVVFQEVKLREVSGKGTFTRGGPKQ